MISRYDLIGLSVLQIDNKSCAINELKSYLIANKVKSHFLSSDIHTNIYGQTICMLEPLSLKNT